MKNNSALLLAAMFFCFQAKANLSEAPQCEPSEKNVDTIQFKDERYVELGGIKQWISVKTTKCNAPLLLMIHGGPGNPSSYYTNSFFETLEQHFIVVHWDQRGSGKTLGVNINDTPFDDYLVENKLSVDQLTADGLELTEYLLKKFNKPKLVLRGGSWGAFLALKMAHIRPSLFYAYVGHSQLVNAKDKHIYGYNTALARARSSGDSNTSLLLKELGKPPYDHPRKYGKLYRMIRGLEKADAPSNTNTSSIISRYDSALDQKNRSLGDDYSWMHFVGFQRIGIRGMLNDIALDRLENKFEIPIYLFQGAHDITTPASITKPYFDKIVAPHKAYFLIPDSAHTPSDKMLDKELKLLINTIKRLAG